MLNHADTAAPQSLGLVDYESPSVAHALANGMTNTGEETLLANIDSAIRRGLPQMRTGPVRPDQICLVGSGPSLRDTEDELRELLWGGAILVTMNGGYHWCRERNLQPRTQIVMDARPTNARFVTPHVARCTYVLASQCAPAVFDAVADYESVWIFHAVVRAEGPQSELLDRYYAGNWMGVGGGTTVATRAISLLRMSGYVRFHLFGVDCCWDGTTHHALPQPENDREGSFLVRMKTNGAEYTFRTTVAMLKQYEDLLTICAVNGQHFQLEAHGNGMFAQHLRAHGDTTLSLKE